MSFLKRAISKAKGRLGPPLPIRGGKPILNKGPGSRPMPIRPPAPILGGRDFLPKPPGNLKPPMPISIGRPPSIGRPINIGRPVAPPGGIRPLPIQPPSIGGPINIGTPITGQPLVPGSGNVPPIQDDGLVTDPYGNRIDPNNLPDNMVLEDGGLKGGMRAVFAPDYALQPNDPGYNQPGGGGYRPGMRPVPISIGGPGGGITSVGQPLDGSDPGLPRLPGGQQPVPPQDFGFGPGIRPSEIITPDGQFIGSGSVTPPSMEGAQEAINQQLPFGDLGSSLSEQDPIMSLGGNPNFDERGSNFDPRKMPISIGRIDEGRPPAPILGGSDFLPKPPGDLTGIGQPLRNEIGPIGGSDEIDPNVSVGSGFFDDPVIPRMGNENPVPFDPRKMPAAPIVQEPIRPIGPTLGGSDFLPKPGFIGGPGIGPPKQIKPVGLPDFGFGPGIRPTEIIGPNGQFIGSGGVTPPSVDPVIPSMGNENPIPFTPPTTTPGSGVKAPMPVNDGPGSMGRPVAPILGGSDFLPKPPDLTPAPVVTSAPVTPPEPVTPPVSTTVAANQPTQAPVTDPAPVVEPSPTQTTAAPQVSGETPYAAGVTQIQSGLDPLTEQLLFGLGGQGGFIPGAMRAAEKVFYDDQGQPVVIDEQVAGFSPDQLAAMQMQRQSLGMQDPYLQGAAGAYGSGTQALEEGLQRGRTAAIGALGATQRGVGSLQRGLGESADILRGTVGSYDPSMTDRFYDPYEDRVVQQTIKDIMKQGAKSDIGARAGDIARGGESAFGSRARLGAGERQEALGRGLAEAVSGIRSQGFREAQQTGLGEFARQKAAERAASTGLAGLAGQGFGGSQALAGALTGLGGTEQQIGQQRYSGQFGLGSSLQGLGAQAAGASASDIASLYGMGSQQQGMTQAMLDAQRRNMQQRQMTPLLQYQALAPFVGMAPAGQFQTTTQFAPRPSAMQTGIGTGLSAFGALGNLYGGS